jgi:hypothetical protein
MAKTSGAHPVSTPETTTMVARTRPSNCRNPLARYIALYAAPTPPNTKPTSSQKTKTKKKRIIVMTFLRKTLLSLLIFANAPQTTIF